MDRRHALAVTTLALASGCRQESPPPPTTPVPPLAPDAPPRERLEGADLVPVEVDPSREILTVAGLRPFRPDGFVVRREEVGAKALIHNYGHGGGGMSLSWGSSQQAVRLAGSVSGQSCAVVGGGVMGLSTARLLQHRGARVTV